MRFMILLKADKNTEAGVMPSEKLLAEMGKYNLVMCRPQTKEVDQCWRKETAMKRVMVRYKVKVDRAAEDESYITECLNNSNAYASFKLDDGVSLVHIVSLEAADATS